MTVRRSPTLARLHTLSNAQTVHGFASLVLARRDAGLWSRRWSLVVFGIVTYRYGGASRAMDATVAR